MLDILFYILLNLLYFYIAQGWTRRAQTQFLRLGKNESWGVSDFEL